MWGRPVDVDDRAGGRAGRTVEVPSVTLFAARVSVTVPSVGAAEERDTVYGPAPLPVTPLTAQPPDVPPTLKSPAARPVTASLNQTVSLKVDPTPIPDGPVTIAVGGPDAAQYAGDQAGDVQPFAGEVLPARDDVVVAAARRSARSWLGVSPELQEASRASAPVTCGAAIEVPSIQA